MYKVLLIIATLLCVASTSAQTTIEEYTAQVIEYNIPLQQASLAIEAAEADLRRLNKGQLPAILFNRSATLNLRHSTTERRVGWGTSLEAQQLIYGGGSVRAAIKSGRCELELKQLEEQMRHRDVVLSAQQAYWQLSHATEYRLSIEEYVGIIAQLREVIEHRYEEGYSPKGDLLQIEARLSDAEYLQSEAEQAYLISLHNYNSLCGNRLDRATTLEESILDNIALPERDTREELCESHPEWQMATLRSEIARWAVRSTNAPFLPEIRLNIFGNMQPLTLDKRSSKISFGGGATLDFRTPIFHFGERRVAVAAAESRQLISEVELEAIEDRILLEEQDAWTNILHTLSRVETSARSLEIARENLEISTYAYNEGRTTIVDVMQAQISWLQSYRNMLTAHYDYAIAIAEYRWIVG